MHRTTMCKNRTESNLQVKNASHNNKRFLFYSHEYYVIAQIPKTVTSINLNIFTIFFLSTLTFPLFQYFLWDVLNYLEQPNTINRSHIKNATLQQQQKMPRIIYPPNKYLLPFRYFSEGRCYLHNVKIVTL